MCRPLVEVMTTFNDRFICALDREKFQQAIEHDTSELEWQIYLTQKEFKMTKGSSARVSVRRIGKNPWEYRIWICEDQVLRKAQLQLPTNRAYFVLQEVFSFNRTRFYQNLDTGQLLLAKTLHKINAVAVDIHHWDFEGFLNMFGACETSELVFIVVNVERDNNKVGGIYVFSLITTRASTTIFLFGGRSSWETNGRRSWHGKLGLFLSLVS